MNTTTWLGVAALIASGGLGQTKEAGGLVEPPAAERPVATFAPPEGEFVGLVEAHRIVELSSPVDGLIDTVNVDRGDEVRKDEIIATLESRVERATLEIAKARADLVAELESRDARAVYHRRKLDQDKELHRKGILSADELEQSRTEEAVAAAAVVEARENLRLAALEAKKAEEALELRTIRSPFDGVVIERFLSPGELVTRQYQSKILTLAQIDPLRVEVLVPEDLFGRIAAGMKAEVVAQGLPGRRSEAEVASVDRVIDAASGTFQVRLRMPNPDGRVPAGMQCKLRFLE